MRNLGTSIGNARARIGAAVLVVSALTVPGDGVAQQTGKGQYVVEAATRLNKLIAAANKAGYDFQDNSFSIGGGWLKQSEKNWAPLYTLNLHAGKKYRFIAAGDVDTLDVDLDIQDGKGKTLAADDSAEPSAVVDFTPETTGKYVVRVRLYKSQDNASCMCLAVVLAAK